MNTVFPPTRLSISVCLYPELTFIVESNFTFPKMSIHSSIRGTGMESRLVTLFSFLYYMQKRSETLLLGSNKIGTVFSVAAHSIIFSVNIRQISAAAKFP